MRSIRIYSPRKLLAQTTLELTGTAARHIAQVLRMSAGDPLILFDGTGSEFAGTIQTAAKALVTVRLDGALSNTSESTLKISLWHGLCRSSRMDSVVQKATELGVAEIQPVLSEHGIVRLDTQRATKKAAHWRSVAISACEQSGRTLIPTVNAPRTLVNCLEDFRNSNDNSLSGIMCDPDGTSTIGPALIPGKNIVLLTGPEGGFSPGEKAAAIEAGFIPVVLGPRILRTETAPIAALSLLQYLAGDLGKGSQPD